MSFLFSTIQQELQKIGLILDRRSILKAIQQQEMIAKQRERQLLASKALDEAMRLVYIYESQVDRTKETVDILNQLYCLKHDLIGAVGSKKSQNEILQRLQNLQKKRNYRRKRWDVNYANQ